MKLFIYNPLHYMCTYKITILNCCAVTMAVTLGQCAKAEILKFKKRLLLRCIHHFKSDLINNMDHMRISGDEPLAK